MRSTFLPFSPPAVGEEEVAAVSAAIRSGWLTTGGITRRFEEEFAAFLGAPGALALNSCTAALHTALATLEIGPGDEVITTPMTFAASVNVIEHVGARPILVDVEADTLNIDPDRVRAAVTARTKAIIPVHYTGHPVELDAINDIASRRGLSVIEDAAHALPARYKGRAIGATANPVAFSFYATKNLTTGEGGMLTGSPAFLERARVWSLHGMSRGAYKRYEKGGSWKYDIEVPGFKYNMTDVAAAMGRVQLQKLASFQERRAWIVERYRQAFDGHRALECPRARAGVDHAWHLYVLRINREKLTIGRDRFIEELGARNIGTSVHFIPVHLHPYYQKKYGYPPRDLPVASDQFGRLVSLPLNPVMTDQDVDDVCEAVLDVANAHASA